MKNLRNRFERFCYQNRTKGIPNLMLFVSLGSALVYIMSMFDQSSILYSILCFNRKAILQGQIWRLFTYVFTYDAGNILLTAVSLFCYYSLGRAMEITWGTFRFNLFYFTGMILMDSFCMLFGGSANVYYLNLSMFIGYATLYPDTRFFLFFIIPVKMKWLAWLDAAIFALNIVLSIISRSIIGVVLPVVALLNFAVFIWPEVKYQADRFQYRHSRQTVQFKKAVKQQQQQKGYHHKCCVCGKTDTDYPDMTFRYCSKCAGYHCYCQDHIFSHVHFTEE